MNYLKYLASNEWQRRRQAAISRVGGQCETCNRAYELEVHHLTYERLGHEREDDLLVVCSRCHSDIHFDLRRGNIEQGVESRRMRMMLLWYEAVTEQEFISHAINLLAEVK